MPMSEKALALMERCKTVFKYQRLPDGQSEYARRIYREEIPPFLSEFVDTGSDMELCAVNGQLIARGFNRIVVGDYGAFVEFNNLQANITHFITMPGQEYRSAKAYSSVKFLALTLDSFKNEKSRDIYNEHSLLIYKQLKTVPYADYQPGKYYVSVYQVKKCNI